MILSYRVTVLFQGLSKYSVVPVRCDLSAYYMYDGSAKSIFDLPINKHIMQLIILLKTKS